MKARSAWIILVCVSGIGSVGAQFPAFPDSNAMWRTDEYDGPNFIGSYYYFMEQADHDSLIHGEWYDLIWIGVEGQSTGLIGGLREDADQRIYFYHANTDSTYLLYDFDPEVGDSMEVWSGDPLASFPITQWMFIESIGQEVNPNGTIYKAIGIARQGLEGHGAIDWWIQGVGGTGGLFTTIGSLSVSVYTIHGCMVANDTLWPGGQPGTCGPTGVTENKVGNFLIFPNPNQGRFTLHLPERAAAVESMTLWNAQGQQFQVHPRGSGPTISVSLDVGIPSGMYMLRLHLADGSILHTKIIIQP
ncbi:MAG: T9SS type A sorting domain-containing protein [Bacteroidetes bacterium]|nr:T9SS type A sorting domain-containing protein [Bacteroidota bacterium]